MDTNGGACQSLNVTSDGQRSFEYAQPCASSVSASLTLNTSLLAAGQHSLELIVEDAAGNKTIAYNGTITTSGPSLIGVNGGSIGGEGVANGQSPCAGEALELAVNGKTKPPVIPYGKAVTVKGVLHCGTVPIRNARIAIVTLGGPANAAIDSSVQTALDGSFFYKVPTGPDRSLEFSYTAYSNDPGPSATATATIMIRPRIKLRIKPHHSSDGRRIYWTGTVVGGPYPQQGVALDVEVQEGRHWRIFDQVVANGEGQFRYSYRFHATNKYNDIRVPRRPSPHRRPGLRLHAGRVEHRQGARHTMSSRKHGHRRVQVFVGALAGAVCLLFAPSFASAGTFTALTCHDPSGNAIGTRGWSVGSASPDRAVGV